jgi:hypothetical protein
VSNNPPSNRSGESIVALYESELTGFLRQLKQNHPDMESGQQESRAYWWERHSGAENLHRWQHAQPARGSYVYYGTAHKDPAKT